MGALEAAGQARAIALTTSLLTGNEEDMFAAREGIADEVRYDRNAVNALIAGLAKLTVEALAALGIYLDQPPLELLQMVAPRLISEASDPDTVLESERYRRRLW